MRFSGKKGPKAILTSRGIFVLTGKEKGTRPRGEKQSQIIPHPFKWRNIGQESN